MNTILYLTDYASLYMPGIVAAIAVALLGAMLSVTVVLKRLAFIGQGVSHAAFGGVGLAFALGLAGGSAGGDLAVTLVVTLFSIAAALVIAWLSDRPNTHADTAIGIVLAASMAIGFLLFAYAGREAARAGVPGPPELESVLFGSVLEVRWRDALLACGVTAAVGAVLWWTRRQMRFWAFDAIAAESFGVRTTRMRTLLLVLLALSVVIAMKLAGIVLTTAVFVLPGATALQLTDRHARSTVLSIVAAMVGVVGGLALSFELDWAAGPGIVLAMVAIFVIARGATALRSLAGSAGPA